MVFFFSGEKMLKTSYFKLQEKYGGEFVATKKARVLAHAKTLEELLKGLKKKGIPYGPAIRIGHIHPPDAVCIYALFH